jgi:hypothetical protein
MDEPTNHLDIHRKAELLMKSLKYMQKKLQLKPYWSFCHKDHGKQHWQTR